MRPNKKKTVVHSCSSAGDMGVCMRMSVSSPRGWCKRVTLGSDSRRMSAMGFHLLTNNIMCTQATGEITTTKTLDRETTSVYNLRVMAEDCKSVARSGKTRSFNATTFVLVLILDENDNSPLFNSTYTFTVREDAASRHEVGRVFAKDKDAGKNGDLTYCILAGNSGDR